MRTHSWLVSLLIGTSLLACKEKSGVDRNAHADPGRLGDSLSVTDSIDVMVACLSEMIDQVDTTDPAAPANQEFLDCFPRTFAGFSRTFVADPSPEPGFRGDMGGDYQNGVAAPLSDSATQYLELLDGLRRLYPEACREILLGISSEALWESDAVTYLQTIAIDDFRERADEYLSLFRSPSDSFTFGYFAFLIDSPECNAREKTRDMILAKLDREEYREFRAVVERAFAEVNDAWKEWGGGHYCGDEGED